MKRLVIAQTVLPTSVSATGRVVVDAVPLGYRRRYFTVLAELLTGTFTFAQLSFRMKSSLSALPLKDITPATSVAIYPADGNFLLEEGWELVAWVNALTVAGTWDAFCCYQDEAYL